MSSTFQQIQTAPQLALLLSSKQHKLLDAKTLSLLTPTLKDSDPITTPAAYCSYCEQLIAAQAIKTIVNVWSLDQQSPSFKGSLADKIICLEVDPSETILLGGTESGMVFVWEVPAGVLLKKFVGHSRRIVKVTSDSALNIVTASESEVKVWRVGDVLGDENKEVRHNLTVNMKEKITDIKVNAQRLFVLTTAGIIVYKLYNLSKELVFQIDTTTCFTTTPFNTHIYAGLANNNIHEFRVDKDIDYKEVVMSGEGMQISKTTKQRVLSGHKSPITALNFMNSLRYLISTSKVGEIIIWFNGQIKKQISLKLEIHQILIIPRPSNHKPNYTQMLVKQTKPRIKALHKYEQGKQTEPMEFICQEQITVKEENTHETFKNIMDELINEKGQLRSQIGQLRRDNEALTKCNQHYAKLFLDKFDL